MSEELSTRTAEGTVTEPDEDEHGGETTPPSTSSVDTSSQTGLEVAGVEHGTPRLSAILAVVASVVGVALTAAFSVLGLLFGVSGLIVVAGALFLRDSRSYLSLGIGLALLGATITGAYGALSPELMIIGISALIIAWDIGQHGISIGAQLGRDTRTQRLELVHAGMTTLVIAVIDVAALLTFELAGTGRPESAVALVVLGAVILIWAFRS